MATHGILVLVGLFGALQALLLAGATWWGARHAAVERGQTRLLASLFVVLGLVVAAISVDHAGWLAGRFPLEWIEFSLSLAAPPLFLGYARRVIGRPMGPAEWASHLLPLLAWVGWTVVSTRFWSGPGWPPISLLVAYQAAYTVRVAFLAFPGPQNRAPGLAMLRAWVVGFSLVHVAQCVRIAFREVEALVHVVPVTATVALYGLVLFALRSARLLQPAPPPPVPYAGSALDAKAAAEAADRIEGLLRDEELHLDADLDLGTLASRVGLSRSHASQVINQTLGTSFAELVNERRVQAARDMLSDPALDHLTVDAVGERAGFASRSSFYESFRRHAGNTPARYRAERQNTRPDRPE